MANFAYTKVPEDDMSEWLRRHTALTRSLRDEREAAGYRVATEDQNKFQLRIRHSGLELVGVPDLVASSERTIVVIDAKTGQHLDRHAAQVKLYMACLPYVAADYQRVPISGEVAYASGCRIEIKPDEACGEFRRDLRTWLELAQSPDPPRKVPSRDNCRFCKISRVDCPERVEDDPVVIDLDDF